MKKLFLFLFLSFSSTSFCETTWIVYGATVVPGAKNIDNPDPSANGIIGEVKELPYIVPEGKVLVITNYGIEGGKTPQYAIIPWIGEQPVENGQGLFTCAAAYGSNYYSGMKWIIPEGVKLNVRISNSSDDYIAYAFGWYMQGYLIDKDELK